MSATIPDLWPSDIDLNVVTPLAILKSQARWFAAKTGGLLKASVVSKDDASMSVHKFNLEAPELEYVVTVITAWHPRHQVYPVRIDSFALVDRDSADEENSSLSCETQSDFVNSVSHVLKSKSVRGLIESLIAQSNAKLQSDEA